MWFRPHTPILFFSGLKLIENNIFKPHQSGSRPLDGHNNSYFKIMESSKAYKVLIPQKARQARQIIPF